LLTGEHMNEGSPHSQEFYDRIREVKKAHEDELLSKENVVGVGIGYRQAGGEATPDLALVVMVSRKLPAAQLAEEDLIPNSIEGIPVDVQEVGQITIH
jgi:hypothetical protein